MEVTGITGQFTTNRLVKKYSILHLLSVKNKCWWIKRKVRRHLFLHKIWLPRHYPPNTQKIELPQLGFEPEWTCKMCSLSAFNTCATEHLCDLLIETSCTVLSNQPFIINAMFQNSNISIEGPHESLSRSDTQSCHILGQQIPVISSVASSPCIGAYIPVLISNRSSHRHVSYHHRIWNPHTSNLVTVQRQHKKRRPRSLNLKMPPTLLMANIRSFNNKREEIAILLQRHSPQVAFFSETWLDSSTYLSYTNLSGYSSHRKDRDAKGGGLLVYIRSDTPYVDVLLLPSAPTCSSIAEISAFYFPDSHYLLVCLYHPLWGPSPQYAITCDYICRLIDFVLCSYSSTSMNLSITLCGDFNDLRLHLTSVTDTFQLSQVVPFPTRGLNTLDNIFTNASFSYAIPTKLPPIGSSDHCCILWCSKNLQVKSRNKKVTRPSNPSKFANFMRVMALHDWTQYALVDDVQDGVQQLEKAIFSIYSDSFPTKTISFSSADKPWINSSIKDLINLRDAAYSEKKTLKYLRLRDCVKQAVSAAKKSYITRSFNSKNSGDIWKAVRHLVGSSSPTVPHCALTADDLNLLFLNTQQSSSVDLLTTISPLLGSLPSVSIAISPVEVWQQLNKLKRKSAGVDSYPSWVLRSCSELLAEPVANLFSRCFKDCIFPDCYKRATIIPIPKPGSSDFRPISLLPHLSKLMEKFALSKWLSPTLKSLDSSQFAFTGAIGNGTSSALTLISDTILRHLDQRPGASRVLLIDFAKAFDKASHSVILQRMCELNIPLDCVRWTISFLTDRHQRVILNDSISSWAEVISGVPQGSVLGPSLFALLISSLKPLYRTSRMVKYADDITLIHNFYSNDEDHLSDEWMHIQNWALSNSLPINFLKTKVLNVSTNKSLLLPPLFCCDGTLVEAVDTTRLLGITFSSDLKWNGHIELAVKKANRAVFPIIVLKRSGAPPKSLWRLYFSLVRSILTYGCSVTCNMPSYLLHQLEKIEHRVSHIIGTDCPTPLWSFIEVINTRFANTIKAKTSHPLHHIFQRCLRSGRSHSQFMKQPTRTTRFKNSFIKYS
jgi:hypothetical protein